MMSDRRLDELARQFDDLMAGGLLHEVARPTPASLERINAHFGIILPPDLVDFARLARRFGAWFASLGPDLQSPDHIIRVNSQYRRRRRTRRLPEGLVIITSGSNIDEDFDCLDLSTRHPESGECGIRYWAPGEPAGALYPSFAAYLEAQLRAWRKPS